MPKCIACLLFARQITLFIKYVITFIFTKKHLVYIIELILQLGEI